MMKSFLALLCALAFLFCSASAEGKPLQPGDILPGFPEESFSAEEGALILFFDPAGERSAETLEALRQVEAAYGERIAVTALSVGPLTEELSMSFPVIPDESGLFQQLGGLGTPALALLDSSGRIGFLCPEGLSDLSRLGDIVNAFLGGSADEETAVYVIRVTDQDGLPVSGGLVNICSDAMCTPSRTDGNGLICYKGKPDVYHLDVLKLPDGYAASAESVYTQARSCLICLTVTRD